MSGATIKTKEKRVSQLVKLATDIFSNHEDVTSNLQKPSAILGNLSPLDLAAKSQEGFVEALTYLNRMNLK